MSNRYGPRIVTDGLVLCLDAADSNSYPGSGTTWTDLSGNGNNGTLTNGPTFNSSNKGGIVYDGTNDYVECGSTASITGVSALTNFTLEAVVKWNTVPTSGNGQFFMANVNISGGPPNLTGGLQLGYVPNYGFGFGTFGNNSIVNGSGSFDGVPSSVTVPQANTWYHVVGLKLTTGYYLYLNNVLLSSSIVSTNGGNAPTSLKIGLRQRDLVITSSQSYFNGTIAIAKIYNRGLSIAEITQNYNAIKGRFNL